MKRKLHEKIAFTCKHCGHIVEYKPTDDIEVFKLDNGCEILILNYSIDDDEALQLFKEHEKAYKIEGLKGYFMREDFIDLLRQEV